MTPRRSVHKKGRKTGAGKLCINETGLLLVKAILLDPKSDNIIESSPVRNLCATGHNGDDLDVCEQESRTGADYACFFIQTGSVGNVGDQHSKKVANDLQEIVTLHPTK